MTKKKTIPDPPKFSDFDDIQVPLAPIRIEIAALQKEGTETIPLSEFLWMVHRHVKEAKNVT